MASWRCSYALGIAPLWLEVLLMAAAAAAQVGVYVGTDLVAARGLVLTGVCYYAIARGALCCMHVVYQALNRAGLLCKLAGGLAAIAAVVVLTIPVRSCPGTGDNSCDSLCDSHSTTR